MIVVVDTNVWISGMNFGRSDSIPFRALQRAAGEDNIAICREIEEEIFDTLTVKFDWTEARTSRMMQSSLRRSIRVTLHHTVHLCRDPDDDKILECAERARPI